jgi:methyl-accepting chemotaxis protein
MNFMSIQINSRAGWSNLTCNPMNLFTNSWFQSQEDANKDFERCISNLSTSTTTNLFTKQKHEQEKVLTRMTAIENEYKSLTNEVNRYVTDVSNIAQDFTQQIGTLDTSLDESKQLSTSVAKQISDFINNIGTIFKNISGFV